MRAFLLSFLLCLLLSQLTSAQEAMFELKLLVGMPLNQPDDIAVDRFGNIYVAERDRVIRFDQKGFQDINFNITFHGLDYLRTEKIAFDSFDNIYILDNYIGKVEKYSFKGKLQHEFYLPKIAPNQHTNPSSITIDNQDNLYVAEPKSHRLLKFDTDGNLLDSLSIPDSLGYYYSIAVDFEGNIYMITEKETVVQKYSPEGTLISKFDIRNNVYHASSAYARLAVDKQGNVYASDAGLRKVVVFSKEGNYLREIPIERLKTNAQSLDAFSLTVDSEGFLYIADAQYRGLSRILKVDRTGGIVSQWGNNYKRKKVTTDNAGNVFLLEVNGKINKFSKDGTLAWSVVPKVPEGFLHNTAQSIALDEGGNIFLLFSAGGNPYIHKLDSTGKQIATYKDFGKENQYAHFVDITIDLAGFIYLADFDNDALTRLHPSGIFEKRISNINLSNGNILKPSAVKTDFFGFIYVLNNSDGKVIKLTPHGEVEAEFSTFDYHNPGTGYTPQLALDGTGNLFLTTGSYFQKLAIYNNKGVLTYQEDMGSSPLIGVSRNGKKLIIANHKSEAYAFYESEANYSPQNLINGTVYHDKNADCIRNGEEKGLGGILIEAQPGPYYAITREDGSYTLAADTGSFTLRQIITNIKGRSITPSCSPNQVVKLDSTTPFVSDINFANAVSDTAILTADISSDRRRRCFTNNTTIAYGNTGFATAENAKVYLQFPEYVVLVSADKPYTIAEDGTYVFEVGTLQPGYRGSITIQDSVICGIEEIRGLTVCTRAWITPSPPLVPPVTGSCVSGQGAARFVIRNTGTRRMDTARNYRIYANTELAMSDYYQLAAGDSLVLLILTYGQTMRLEADQADGKMYSVTVEGCRRNHAASFSVEMMNDMPPNDPDVAPAYTETCLPILDSYDPNDKKVVPRGVTDQNYTPVGAALRYRIRFQNTGTDVAYRVVVVDTLSEHLDLSTLRIGAVSHSYRMEVGGKGQPILTWTFNNIMLPDSTSDEPGSHGFIDFSIKPKAGLAEKTLVANWADIYFDYNSPVRTDTTVNRIYDMPLVIEDKNRLDPAQVIVSPTIDNILPLAGKIGTEVVITGSRFSPDGPKNKVYFNDVLAQVITGDSSTLQVKVPGGASTGRIKILTEQAGIISDTVFTVYQPPVLHSFSPAEGIVGSEVTLQGEFWSGELIDSIQLNNLPCSIESSSRKAITVQIPAGAASGKFTVHTKGGTVQSEASYRLWHQPVISSPDKLIQASGAGITIHGKHFAREQNRNIVQFGNIQAEVLQANDTLLQTRVPQEAQSGTFSISTPGGISIIPFELIPAPVIAAISPERGSVGTLVELKGKHFSVFSTNDTVSFNGTEAIILQASDTMIQVRVPRGAATGQVTVAGLGGRDQKDFVVEQLTPQEAIQLYPNPSHGRFTLDLVRADFEVHSFQVMDAIGRLLFNEQVDARQSMQTEVNLSNRRPGIYLVVIYTEQGKVVKKISLL